MELCNQNKKTQIEDNYIIIVPQINELRTKFLNSSFKTDGKS